MDATKGGGVHMWREVWDDDVSYIYRDVLGNFFSLLSWNSTLLIFFFQGIDEPFFGHQPKVDPYAQVKQQKKYIS